MALGAKTIKSESYSKESKVTTISLTIPSGLIVELSVNYNIFGMSHKPIILSFNKTSLVITLIDAPKSIKKF